MRFLRLFLIVNIVVCLVISLVFADVVVPKDSTTSLIFPPNVQNPSNPATGVIWTDQLTGFGHEYNYGGTSNVFSSNSVQTDIVCPPNTCAQLLCPNTQISLPAVTHAYCNLYNFILTPNLVVTTSNNKVSNYTVSFTVMIVGQASNDGDGRKDCRKSNYYFSAQCYVVCQTFIPGYGTSQYTCLSGYGVSKSNLIPP